MPTKEFRSMWHSGFNILLNELKNTYIYILDDYDDDDEDRIRMTIQQIQNPSNNWDS